MSRLMEASSQPTKMVTLVMFKWEIKEEARSLERGDVMLTSNTGCKIVLKDVRHVPEIRLNLISTGKLDDAGLDSHFGGGK